MTRFGEIGIPGEPGSRLPDVAAKKDHLPEPSVRSQIIAILVILGTILFVTILQ